MQSLYVLRLVFSGIALSCTFFAIFSGSWNVIERSDLTTTTKFYYEKITFGPEGYCWYFSNGTTGHCNDFSLLLIRADHPVHRFEYLPSPLDNSSTPQGDKELEVALTAWCSSKQQQEHVSWVSHSARDAICVLMLELCYCTMMIWAACGAVATFVALVSIRGWWKLNAFGSSCTLSAAFFGIVLLMEWWWYEIYFVDTELLHEQHLVFKFGASFHFVFLSNMFWVFASVVATRLVSKSIHGGNYARLFSISSTSATTSGSSDTMSNNGSPLSSQNSSPKAIDPLKCPANYKV